MRGPGCGTVAAYVAAAIRNNSGHRLSTMLTSCLRTLTSHVIPATVRMTAKPVRKLCESNMPLPALESAQVLDEERRQVLSAETATHSAR